MNNIKNHLFTYDVELRVRYGETDQMGYCYYGNYAQYFEVGRVETMRNLGMTYKQIEELGYMLPVRNYSVNYLLPAYYDDLLIITTNIIGLNGVRLVFEYIIKNEKGQLIATAETTLVFVNKQTMKPTHPPQDFIQLLNKKR